MNKKVGNMCRDNRDCFARRKDGKCTILWTTEIKKRECHFCKSVRLITKGIVYPWEGHPDEVKKAYRALGNITLNEFDRKRYC